MHLTDRFLCTVQGVSFNGGNNYCGKMDTTQQIMDVGCNANLKVVCQFDCDNGENDIEQIGHIYF
jgi:hypothetical protein